MAGKPATDRGADWRTRSGTPTAIALVLALLLGGRAESAPPTTAPAAAIAPSEAEVAPKIARDARIIGDATRTRLVVDLSDPIDVAVFTLADPYRVVIDLPELHFAFPVGTGASGRGLVSAFRYGLISAGKSRFVLDVTGPVKVEKASIQPASGTDPARLTVDLSPATRADFLAALQANRDKVAAPRPALDASAVLAASPRNARPTVVIDPGHGGIDLGARSPRGVLEKDVVLAFSRVLADRLRKSGRYDVYQTRTDDSFLSLDGRVEFARAHNADLFVSIHANIATGTGGGLVRGAVVYTISDHASDKMAAAMAEAENRADILAGIDLGVEDNDQVKDILLDLTRRETRNFAVVFAQSFVKSVTDKGKLFKVPHQQANFKVLEAPEIPSALIELGYLSNPDDEKALTSADWRDRMAEQLSAAVDAFFGPRADRQVQR